MQRAAPLVYDAPTLRQLLVAGGSNIIVAGLGISGIESALALSNLGHRVLALDDADSESFRQSSRYGTRLWELEAAGVVLGFSEAGRRLGGDWQEVALAIVSPGIPDKAPIRVLLAERHIPQYTEFEVGIILADRPVIMVTGSNGKSTTVSLLAAVLQRCAVAHRLVGNIGEPVISGANELLGGQKQRETEGLNSVTATTADPLLVVEASSYQLEASRLFAPDSGVFLNLSENHLERHGSLERYFAAKLTPFTRQGPNATATYNIDDEWVRRVPDHTEASVVPFGRGVIGDGVAISRDRHGVDSVVVRGLASELEIKANELKLLGVHNLYNIAAVLGAVARLGLGAEEVRQGIVEFGGIPHRCENLGVVSGNIWINDSKSTTVAATCAAVQFSLDNFPGRPLVLLVGGVLKEGSWSPLLALLESCRHQLKRVIAFGDGAQFLCSLLGEFELPVIGVAKLHNAVAAVASLGEGNVALLSPGGASFDEFRGFDERGEAFRSYVSELDLKRTGEKSRWSSQH